MEQLGADVAKAVIGAGPVAALLFYFLWQKQKELDSTKSKCDQYQAQIVAMLQAQLESEPARRETLSKLTRLVEDQSVVLKGLLK